MFYPYQQQGVEFIEKALAKEHSRRSEHGVLVGDEPGLGKTIQAIGYLRYNPSELPVLIICPAAVTIQWQQAWKNWFQDAFPGHTNVALLQYTPFFIPGQNCYIISNSILAKPGIITAIKQFNFKTVIIDESHQFKTATSNRTVALQTLVDGIQNRICLSGTSVLNRTMEYFNTLNIINSDHWPTSSRLQLFCQADKWGKLLGLKDTVRNVFFETTKNYIIRRRKADVLADLPEKRVSYEFISMAENAHFVRDYNKLTDELEFEMSRIKSSAGGMMQLLVIMGKMRQLAAMAKIPHVLEGIHEFMDNAEDGDKLAIGLHHKFIRETLMGALQEYNPITISDESPEVKTRKIDEFRNDPKKKLLFASMIGCGTGLNIQFCTNVKIIERQWNRAMEHQFEDRFHRIGLKTGVDIDYMMVKDTIEEFFHDMVILKGMIMHGILDSGFEQDTKFMMDLAERVVQKRMQYAGK